MASEEQESMELFPSFRERIRRSIFALIGLAIGIIVIVGALLFVKEDMIMFISVFIGALLIFFSLWRVLIIYTNKLCINAEEIRYRERFIWQRVNWSDVISIGRANDIDVEESSGVLKKIKSLLIMTKSGLQTYDMSSYSLTHGLEIVNQVMESRPKEERDEIEEVEETEEEH